MSIRFICIDIFKSFMGGNCFEHIRLEAEKIARESLNDADQDVTLDEIYTHVPSHYRPFKNIELEFESSLLRPREEGLRLYRQALKENKKIAIISDMYLPQTFLENILRQNGVCQWNFFYLSSAKKKAKYTGDLFRTFLKDSGICSQKILHIGDNYISDVCRACEVGLQTMFKPKITDMFFSSQRFCYFKDLYERNASSLTLSVLFGVLAQKFSFNDKLFQSSENYWRDFGYVIAGPVYWGFSEFILQVISQHEIKQCLFMARDCYILKKIFDLIKPNDVKSFYLYAERIIYAQCFLSWGDNENADNVLSVLQENASGLKTPSFQNLKEKEEFLNKHLYLVRDEAEKNKVNYEKYLLHEKVDFFKKTALVDTGAATFSAQSLLSAFVKAPLKGIYVTAQEINAQKKGFQIQNWAVKSEEVRYVRTFIEFLMMSPEPPVVGIQNCAPVYQKNIFQEEIARGKICKAMEPGIIEFVKDMNTWLKNLRFVPKVEDLNCFLEAFLAHLSEEDFRQFATIKSSSNGRHTAYNQGLLENLLRNLYKVKELYFLHDIPFMTIYSSYERIFVKAFKFLPLLDIQKNVLQSYVKLWKIPILRIRQKKRKYYIYLFNVVPLFAFKNKI